MAKEELGMVIKLEADANNLQQELRKLQSNLVSIDKQGRSLKNAVKFDSSNVSNYAKVVDNLKTKQTELAKVLSTTQERGKNLNAAYALQVSKVKELEATYKNQEIVLEQLKAKYGENSEEVKKYSAQHEKTKEALDEAVSKEKLLEDALQSNQKKYDETSAKITETSAELKKYENALEGTGTEADKASNELKKYGTSAEDAGNSARKSAEASEVVSEKLTALNVAAGQLVADGIKKLIDGFKKLATSVVDSGSSLEDGVNGLAAILQVSKDSYTIHDLSDYFEELGTKSKYSAAEIANNAQILANAGYESDQIKDSIKVIGDLAAGTGESFESMSNIVVDGLAAFGMSANEATHFSDVLAKSAISSNTNVEMMGEAFKYVGSVAGTFGYSVEDVGVALGAMANQGIKASTAGTSLRSILTRLATNTSDARTAIEDLGISFFDADGKARDLIGSLGPDGVAGTADDTTGILDDLRSALSGMNDEQKATIEKTIGGQRAMTALAAIVNTSTDDWNKLKSEVADYNGTVEGMAETRLDSYSGDIKILKNNWEQTASTLFKEVEPSLRKVIQSLTTLMQTDFFKKDIKKVAEGFANALSKLGDIISSINPKTVATASTFAKLTATFGGTVTLLPKAVNLFSSVGSTVQKLGTLTMALSNTFSHATSTTAAFQGAASVLGSAGLPLIATGVGLAATAFVAFTSGLNEAQQVHREEMNALYGLNEATQTTIDNVHTLSESYTTLQESTSNNAASVTAQYSYYEQLATEYDSIIAKQDQMTNQDKDRANTILTILSEAFGVEKTDIQELINEHGGLSSAIQETIEKKKADALLTVYQEQYAQAIKNVSEAQADQNTLLAEREEKQTLVNQLTDQATALHHLLSDSEGLTAEQAQNLTNKYQDVLGRLSLAQDSLGKVDIALDENKATLEESQSTISNYEALVGAASSGSAEDVELATARMTSSFKTANDASYNSLYEQTQNYRKQWQSAKQECDSGSGKVSQTQVDLYKKLYDMSNSELSKARKQWKEYGKNQVEGAEEGQKSAQKGLNRTSSESAKQSNDAYKTSAGVNSPSKIWYQYGVYQAQGAINGMNSMQGQVSAAARRLADAANNAYKKRLDIRSPSRVMKQNGIFTAQGAINGMDEMIPKLALKGQEMAEAMNDSIQGYIQSGSLNSTTNQYSDNSTYSPSISIQIVQREGEDANALARRVSELISSETKRKKAVWQ